MHILERAPTPVIPDRHTDTSVEELVKLIRTKLGGNRMADLRSALKILITGMNS
jgi:hypothetical protein